ncbi:MAG: 1,4-alpha-glucan branching protein GlgB [Methanomicrobiaceae archaeon]|nr:1,4-alpha-glucan branching protein GlgB [Methanomicrobiaceae archaeon]
MATESGGISGPDIITEYDIYLFKRGEHAGLHTKFGSRPMRYGGEDGSFFAVWAPNAASVSVIGDWNGWNPQADPLASRPDSSGVWEGFVPGAGQGMRYKYHIVSRHHGLAADKGDPFARFWETPPRTASVIRESAFRWSDGAWMETRHEHNGHESPIAIYEVHAGSWRRVPEEGDRPLTYREMADSLAGYVCDMGFTHVEFLPLMEHPFEGSWGYQTEGYFAPTSRFGTPDDFMHLIDRLHRHGIGVILDWVPSHFPADDYGLARFDGTHLFEHAHPSRGFHPEWTSCIFNHGRYEVQAFLLSSAMFWLDQCHVDGLRVDAVSSMLYLDYARASGEWVPNRYGGREDLEAIAFLRRLNEVAYKKHPDVQIIAEESTAWPMVTRPTYTGGLGFGMKWNMGWMHDTLRYFSKDPVYRKYHHDELLFSMVYAFTENFILPLSHDEVVHGKGSLIGRMPGDDWQKFAGLRLLFGYMYTHPGKKLLFMGGEFGQRSEWDHTRSLEWHVLDYPPHEGVQRWVRDLNRLYRSEPALHKRDFSPEGFAWVDHLDWEQSVVSYLRNSDDSTVLAACNFTPVPRHGYRIGVPAGGFWRELLCSDAVCYGGSGCGNFGGCGAEPVPSHGYPFSLSLTLPPLGVVVLKPEGR